MKTEWCYFERKEGDSWELTGDGIKFNGDFCNYIVAPRDKFIEIEFYNKLGEEIERLNVELQQLKEKNKKEDPMEYYRQYARNKEK